MAAYTTTKEFQDTWNRAARGIENAVGEASKYVKSKAKSLSKAIGKSFSKAKKRYRNKTEIHHIVAQRDPRAKVARWVFKKVGKKTKMVCSVMQSAYYKKAKVVKELMLRRC